MRWRMAAGTAAAAAVVGLSGLHGAVQPSPPSESSATPRVSRVEMLTPAEREVWGGARSASFLDASSSVARRASAVILRPPDLDELASLGSSARSTTMPEPPLLLGTAAMIALGSDGAARASDGAWRRTEAPARVAGI